MAEFDSSLNQQSDPKKDILSESTPIRTATARVAKVQEDYEKYHGVQVKAFRQQGQKSDEQKQAEGAANPTAYSASVLSLVENLGDTYEKPQRQRAAQSYDLSDAANHLLAQSLVNRSQEPKKADEMASLGRRLLGAAVDALDERRSSAETENQNSPPTGDRRIVQAVAALEQISVQLRTSNPKAAKEDAALAKDLRTFLDR